MSEAICWKALTPEQRDRCVAEKVMGWTEQLCDLDAHDGMELAIYDSGDAYCPRCHAYGYIDDLEHGIIPPPRYTQSMDAAWLIVEKMVARMGYENIGFKWIGPLFKPEHVYLSSSQHSNRNITWHFDYTQVGGFDIGRPCWYVKMSHEGHYWWIMADTTQDAICLAALQYCGVEIETKH